MAGQTTESGVDSVEAFKRRHFDYMREVVSLRMKPAPKVQESATAAVPQEPGRLQRPPGRNLGEPR
jgi:hypothetical protein